MMRLIDADALKTSILNSLGINSEAYLIFGSDKKIWKLINDAPTIQPDTDTVSRQKMINTVNNLRTRCDNDIDAYHDLIVAAIDALPSSLTVTECTDMVSRQAVLDAVDVLKKWSLLDKHGQHVGVGVFCNEIKTKVKGLPSSPTLSRPHGHWIDKGITGDWAYCIDGHGNCWHEYKCSECNHIYEQKSNFCPHCGANMRQNGGAV